MFETVYVERSVKGHDRVAKVLARFPDAHVVECESYGEVFNRRRQNFRLQKRSPDLVLARKEAGWVLPTPEGYGIGGARNYYFSHLLNCLYDCRYCFLQGMFRSAHIVFFVNREDLEVAIDERLADANGEVCWFFSGYDCDSLAFDPITGFAGSCLDFFSGRPRAWIELRTKSTRIEALVDREPAENCVVAWSFTPARVSGALEHGVPDIERRLEALARVQEHGWRVGLRFDPLIRYEGWRDDHRELFERVFRTVDVDRLHSVSIGAFRLPRAYFKTMVNLYPEEKLFASPFEARDGVVRFEKDDEEELVDTCSEELRRFVPAEILHPCGAGGQASL